MDPEWIEVPGGACLFGDAARPIRVPTLLWTQTPITHGQLTKEPSNSLGLYPVTAISHAAAQDIAARLGGRLPRAVEWEWMAAGSQRRRWPWGDDEWQPGYANLRDAGYGSLTPVNAHPAGATPEGLLDVAGNVWEWTAHATTGGGAVVRGGSYASPPLYARCTFVNAAPAELRSAGIGLRVVREP